MSASVLKLNSVPTRLMARVTPKASASSLPLNQRASITFCAVMSDSEPAPNRKRPRYAIWILGARATIHRPGDQEREGETGGPRSKSVNENAPDQQRDDRCEAVQRVESTDRSLIDIPDFHELVGNGAHTVIRKVTAVGQKANEEHTTKR